MATRAKFVSLFIMFILSCSAVPAQSGDQQPASASEPRQTGSTRDGQHDFDFDLGTWKTHSSRLLKPLTGSTAWADMDGITVVSKVWNGRANLAEYKAEGSASQVELLSLRFYNPQARQWNLVFATPKAGTLSVPCVGEFKQGRGDFYDQEEFNGKSILVRFSVWSISPETAQSEQAFSEDGGKTWEVNWINKYTKASDGANIAWNKSTGENEHAGAHDFDFNLGTWHTEIQRNLDPFSPAAGSITLSGTVSIRKVWGGRARLEEIETDGPKGHWEGLSLFLFNPQSHQWSQTFINSQMGVLTPPLIGSFKNGRGELIEQDTFKNRSILVRGVWSDISPNAHTYEESYSEDSGRTWKRALIARKTREKD